MSKFEEYTATLPAHWASALINGDTSGMSDDEELNFNSFIRCFPEYAEPVSCSDHAELTKYHDAPGVLACDCLTFTYLRVIA